ncbi:hypothetical protein ES319_D09G077500v1 [Gossypium barbadense]|uniref:Cytochrome P450 n=1 Tax=Gossypium barbadense TaxID=3634 RepID=A0A5J5PZZ5_GOSBA|nr:hypothetical protein ES319_D09G077500v1 [Gossypium barbadense]
MDPLAENFLTILAIFCSFYILFYISKHGKGKGKALPGPQPLPIIGNLHMLSMLPHESLYHLAKKHGAIMSIRLGSVPAVVVSSPEVAKIFLKTHDVVFASRPKFQVLQSIYNGKMGIAFTEYGPYWRSLTKFCNQQLFTASKIESFAPSRKEVLTHFIESLKEAAAAKEVVNISKKVGNLNAKMILNMILGPVKKYEEFNLKEIIEELLYMVGVFNLADFVPFLGAFDLQDDFISTMLTELNKQINPNGDIMDRNCIKAITIDMIVASLDTSTAPLEWALLELIKHPRVMLKLQKVLERIIKKRMVEENDLPKFEYLDMVLKETLRLYPVTPMLLPRESRIIVNVWAIGRDPNVWSNNVEEFFPERFVNRNIELHGHDFKLIPFGSGCRVCPGRKLALITVKLILAQLVHCFDWELPGGMSPNELDMTEKFSSTLPRKNNLCAKPIYRM